MKRTRTLAIPQNRPSTFLKTIEDPINPKIGVVEICTRELTRVLGVRGMSITRITFELSDRPVKGWYRVQLSEDDITNEIIRRPNGSKCFSILLEGTCTYVRKLLNLHHFYSVPFWFRVKKMS